MVFSPRIFISLVILIYHDVVRTYADVGDRKRGHLLRTSAVGSDDIYLCSVREVSVLGVLLDGCAEKDASVIHHGHRCLAARMGCEPLRDATFCGYLIYVFTKFAV